MQPTDVLFAAILLAEGFRLPRSTAKSTMKVEKLLEARKHGMRLPNFIIIGAAKSGTTALYHYLKQHPQVYMCPVKEPRFFAFEQGDLEFSGPGDRELHRSTVVTLEEY